MRVIIGGSRSISDPNALDEAVAQAGFSITEVITGNSRGSDALAAAWAERKQVACVVIPVEWNRYGGRAEQIRNDRIADMSDGCILLWDGFSRGTSHLMEAIERRGLKLFVYRCNPQQATDRKTTSIIRNASEIVG